jgi:TonB family protein
MLNQLRSSKWAANAQQTAMMGRARGNIGPTGSQNDLPAGLRDGERGQIQTIGAPTRGGNGEVQRGRYAAVGLGHKTGVTIDVSSAASPSVIGTIDRAGIRRVIVANQNQLKACYERALGSESDLHGKVVLSWDISDSGSASNVRVKESSLENMRLEQCLLKLVTNWRFPAPPRDQIAEVTFPFIFLSNTR